MSINLSPSATHARTCVCEQERDLNCDGDVRGRRTREHKRPPNPVIISSKKKKET